MHGVQISFLCGGLYESEFLWLQGIFLRQSQDRGPINIKRHLLIVLGDLRILDQQASDHRGHRQRPGGNRQDRFPSPLLFPVHQPVEPHVQQHGDRFQHRLVPSDLLNIDSQRLRILHFPQRGRKALQLRPVAHGLSVNDEGNHPVGPAHRAECPDLVVHPAGSRAGRRTDHDQKPGSFQLPGQGFLQLRPGQIRLIPEDFQPDVSVLFAPQLPGQTIAFQLPLKPPPPFQILVAVADKRVIDVFTHWQTLPLPPAVPAAPGKESEHCSGPSVCNPPVRR